MNSPHHVVLLGLVLGVSLIQLLLPPPSQAAGQGVDVASAFESALAIDPELQAAEKRIEAANFAASAARAITPEPLSIEGSYRTDKSFDNQGLREVELGVVAPVWLWGERKASRNLRNAELQTLELKLQTQKLALAAQVRQAYWGTIAAQLDVEIAQTRLLSAKRLLDDVEKRVAAGDLAKADLLQATALHAQAKAEHGSAASNVSQLAAHFTGLTGLPASVLGQPRPESIDTVRTQFDAATHPDLAHAQEAFTTAQRGRELAGIQSRPNPEVGLSIVSDRGAFAAPEEKSLMLGTRIPLGSSAKHKNRVLTAQADELTAQAQVNKLERSLNARAQAAASSLKLFEELQASAEERASAAQEAYSLYQRSFELGETDLPTLLRFEQQAHEAQRLARKAKSEHAAKVSDYKQALGLLPEKAQ